MLISLQHYKSCSVVVKILQSPPLLGPPYYIQTQHFHCLEPKGNKFTPPLTRRKKHLVDLYGLNIRCFYIITKVFISGLTD